LLESFSLFAPTLQAYIATFIEIIGGLCLMLGLASRLVAVPLIIVMVTAYATVHLESVKSIFINPSEFVGQAAFNPLLISLFILAFGPGKYSIDYFFEKWFLGVDLE
jgi:putative oxidoreductase